MRRRLVRGHCTCKTHGKGPCHVCRRPDEHAHGEKRPFFFFDMGGFACLPPRYCTMGGRTLLAGATVATAVCLLLAVAMDKTPPAVLILAKTKGLACGRCGTRTWCRQGLQLATRDARLDARRETRAASMGVPRLQFSVCRCAAGILVCVFLRGGPCPAGPAFIRKAGLTSAAEVAWSKVCVCVPRRFCFPFFCVLASPAGGGAARTL